MGSVLLKSFYNKSCISGCKSELVFLIEVIDNLLSNQQIKILRLHQPVFLCPSNLGYSVML